MILKKGWRKNYNKLPIRVKVLFWFMLPMVVLVKAQSDYLVSTISDKEWERIDKQLATYYPKEYQKMIREIKAT